MNEAMPLFEALILSALVSFGLVFLWRELLLFLGLLLCAAPIVALLIKGWLDLFGS